MLTLLRLATTFPESTSGTGHLLLPRQASSTCRLATGRSALFHMIGRLPPSYARIVMLPSYIAEGVVKPFIAAGYELRFYRLTRELQPDESDVGKLLLNAAAPPVFMLIHYFGNPSVSPSLLSMLRGAGALIVSDCAHAPLSKTKDGIPLGEIGDIALYSLNKLLPVCDGAILSSRTPKVDLALEEDSLPALPAPATEAYSRHLLACRQLFHAPDSCSATEYLAAIEEGYEGYYKIINEDLSPHRQGQVSRFIETVFPYDVAAKTRRDHAASLQGVISSSDVIRPVWPELANNVVPFAVPVRVAATRRDAIQRELFENGVMASTLCDKWNFVPRGFETSFAVETAFLQEHLLLPVSEFMSDEDIALLENTIRRIH